MPGADIRFHVGLRPFLVHLYSPHYVLQEDIDQTSQTPVNTTKGLGKRRPDRKMVRVVRPGAPSSFLFLVVWPGATSGVLCSQCLINANADNQINMTHGWELVERECFGFPHLNPDSKLDGDVAATLIALRLTWKIHSCSKERCR